MSFVWKYYKVADQADAIAECQLCRKGIKRGPSGSPKLFSTTPLHKHLKSKHAKEYNQQKATTEIASQESTSSSSQQTPKQKKLAAMERQMSLEESFGQKKIWDINDHRAIPIHQKIMKMIAIDNQPFTIVEDQGFIELLAHLQPKYMIPSRRYFSEVMLPNAYEDVKSQISAELDSQNAPYLSFTSDVWTSPHSVESFISLTCHWITSDYERKNGVLFAKHFPASHTGENIERMINSMMTQWGIDDERQHILVRDGAANMVLGTRLAGIESAHCFLHILNLVVKDAIFSQKRVGDICAKVRRISTHFNHSSVGHNELKQIQSEKGIKTPLFPVQDVSTRWNSTYLMLERAFTLKREILLYTAEHDLPMLSVSEWDTVEKLIRVLQPFYEITKQVSSEYSTLGDVIPHVIALKRYLSKSASEVGIITTKRELLSALENRLLSTSEGLNILNERNYVLTTFLDPRYKLKFMKDKKEQVKSWLLDEIRCNMEKGSKDSEGNEESNLSINRFNKPNDLEDTAVQENSTNSESQPKPMSLKEEIHRDFLNCYGDNSDEDDEMQEHCTGSTSRLLKRQRSRGAVDSLSEIAYEIDKYANSETAERDQDLMKLWKDSALLFPTLAKVARKYLSCPASSVYSERLFSEAGNVYEEKRSRLLPRTGEQLLFLHHNLLRFQLTDQSI